MNKVKIKRKSDNRYFDGSAVGMGMWGNTGKVFNDTDKVVISALKKPKFFEIISVKK